MTLSAQQARDILTQQKETELALGYLPEQKVFDYLRHAHGAAWIAKQMAFKIPGMDPEQIYVSALLHDIGRPEEARVQRFHGIIGYEKLKDKDENAARTALIHMFPWNKLPAFETCPDLFLGGQHEHTFIRNYLNTTQIRESDLLIQLADCLANKNGFVTLAERFEEYQQRHQVTLPKELIFPRYQLKSYFDQKIGHSVYDLFPKSNQNQQIYQL